MANPQQQRDSGQPARKEPNFDQNNPKQAPGQSHGQGLDNPSGRPQPSGQKQGTQQPHSHGNTGAEPENPADLGHDPKPDNIQTGRRK